MPYFYMLLRTLQLYYTISFQFGRGGSLWQGPQHLLACSFHPWASDARPQNPQCGRVPCNRMCLWAFGLHANTFAVGCNGFADSLASLCVSTGRTGGGQEDKRRWESGECNCGRQTERKCLFLHTSRSPRSKCDWKFSLFWHLTTQYNIAQPADNVTLATFPPFRVCFKLTVIARMWD